MPGDGPSRYPPAAILRRFPAPHRFLVGPQLLSVELLSRATGTPRFSPLLDLRRRAN